ncbi:MAG: tetratricopeptide repeat protein [Candidatus Omnitrophica bacterium]|nr:tetratricopeptide repeat protein [Candidatus Omnitrophota bacterium]
MKKVTRTLLTVLAVSAFSLVTVSVQGQDQKVEKDFGDYSSHYLLDKAWAALEANNIADTIIFTNKVLELYEEEAVEMQAMTTDFPKGSTEEIVKNWWALNDVATALYIQGEIYRKNEMFDKAKEAYQRVIVDFPNGQTWDEQGWFWKPAKAAKEKLLELP